MTNATLSGRALLNRSSFHIKIYVRVDVQYVQCVSLSIFSSIYPYVPPNTLQGLVGIYEILVSNARFQRLGWKGLTADVKDHEIAVKILKVER